MRPPRNILYIKTFKQYAHNTNDPQQNLRSPIFEQSNSKPAYCVGRQNSPHQCYLILTNGKETEVTLAGLRMRSPARVISVSLQQNSFPTASFSNYNLQVSICNNERNLSSSCITSELHLFQNDRFFFSSFLALTFHFSYILSHTKEKGKSLRMQVNMYT